MHIRTQTRTPPDARHAVHTGRATDNAPSHISHTRACVRECRHADMHTCMHTNARCAGVVRAAQGQYPEAKPSQGEDEWRCAHLPEALKRLAASGDENVPREEHGDYGDHRCERHVRQHLPRRPRVTVRPFQSFPAPEPDGNEVTLSGRPRTVQGPGISAHYREHGRYQHTLQRARTISAHYREHGAHPCEQRRRPEHR